MTARIELRHLRYFLAVAETENFTRAAERLAVSQPSVSQQIKDLEEALGSPLFDRIGKRVQLTEAGRAFRSHAEGVLARFDEAVASVDAVAGAVRGHLTICVVPAVNVPWVARALGRFFEQHPGVTVSVRERSAQEVETEVESGRADLGVGVLSHASPNLRYQRLSVDELALIVRRDHELARRESVTLEAVARLRVSMLPEGFMIRDLIDEAFRKAQVRPIVAVELDTVDASLATTVAAGIPTILPAIVLEGRPILALTAVKLAGRPTRMDLGLILRSGGPPSPAAHAFVHALESLVKGAGPGGAIKPSRR